MVTMKALTTYAGAEGFVRRGDLIRVSPSRARVLMRRGLAEVVGGQTVPGPTETQAVVPEETKAEDEGVREDGGVVTAWVCSIDGCGRQFASRRGLVMHQRQAHPEVTVEEGGLYREG